MSLIRAKLSEADRRFIIARSAGCCNKCRKQVFIDNEFGEKARLGDDAHIWAWSDDGPRGRSPGAPDDRNSRTNILLLCKNCHAEVDQQQLKFTPGALTAIRDGHYVWADWCRGETLIQQPRFHYILYLNVPRTDMYAVANSIPVPRPEFGDAKRFRDLGFAAGQVMASYTHVLNCEELYALPIGPDADLSLLAVGQYCFLEPTNTRTVAIDRGSNPEEEWRSDRSIVYCRRGDWTLVCLIDPRWITTSTAGVSLQSGQAELCGVVRIARIDLVARKVYASPLFLAQPEGMGGY
ncbi:MAG: HNH endonuclease [Sphingomicrobium sp.]